MNLKSWFGKKQKAPEGNGLSVSIEELMKMRQWVSYARQFNQKQAYSCQAGDIKSAFKGRGMEFEEIRAYTYGDDVRDIDWRVTARKEKPYTKVFAEEKDVEVYVWLDLSAPMLFGTKNELKSVTASKFAALIGWLALGNKHRFGAILFDGEKSYWFKPQNNRAQLVAIFKKIEALSEQILLSPKQDSAALQKSVKLLEQVAHNRSSVFVISDFNHDFKALKPALQALAKRNILFLIDIFDVLEEKAPAKGEYLAQYGAKRLVLNSLANNYQKQYGHYFADKRKEWNDFCRQNGCSRVEFRTDDDFKTHLKFL